MSSASAVCISLDVTPGVRAGGTITYLQVKVIGFESTKPFRIEENTLVWLCCLVLSRKKHPTEIFAKPAYTLED